jgi:hypothetical protein
MDRLQASVREHASSLHHAARTGPERGIHEPFSGPEVVVAGMRLLAVVLLACALAAAASPAWPASFRGGAIVAPAESVQPLGQVLRRVNERYPGARWMPSYSSGLSRRPIGSWRRRQGPRGHRRRPNRAHHRGPLKTRAARGGAHGAGAGGQRRPDLARSSISPRGRRGRRDAGTKPVL